MPAQIDVTEQDIDKVFRGFLVKVLPTGVPVVKGQVNRVVEPREGDFAIFWPIRRSRISTNVDEYIDVRFQGALALTVLTVTDISFGTIQTPRQLFGIDVAPNTIITEQLTGDPGELGTYRVSISQTVDAEVMAAGSADLMMPTQITYQVDVHGPNSTQYSQMIATAFRDDYGCEQFTRLMEQFQVRGTVQPLYMDDPRQIPFVNDSQQYEFRWVLEANLQANITIAVPQEFADSVVVGLIEVDTTYPP